METSNKGGQEITWDPVHGENTSPKVSKMGTENSVRSESGRIQEDYVVSPGGDRLGSSETRRFQLSKFIC